MTSPRTAPWKWLVAVALVSLVLGGLLGAASAMSPGLGLLPMLLVGVLALGLAVLGVWLTAMYWRRLDEAAREAHKWAWFWGGNAVLLPVVLGVLLLMGRPDVPAPLWPGLEASDAGYVATGGLLVILSLIVGYGLAWLYWWLWKSR